MKFNPRFIKGGALALALVVMAAAFFACAPSVPEATPAPATEVPATIAPATETPAEPEAKALSEFTSIDLDGNKVDNSVFENADVTFINIWGTFCGPCIYEMPDLGKLAKTYADKGVQFIGIVSDASENTQDEIELAKQIRSETGADYLHILNSQSVYDAMMTGVSAIPTSFFVNGKGQIISDIFVGGRSADDWTIIIDEVLEAQS